MGDSAESCRQLTTRHRRLPPGLANVDSRPSSNHVFQPHKAVAATAPTTVAATEWVAR